eukprot:CAMPEP_0174243220 /NCGR_PEP_ID=MMETSP0417-20130205/30893_1 /TAXON_ID=242541 /ORGANISM="Mayorella sp, Strain BSH-02190019" /LENGTH=423 /DNA_ID=CAMNT_0015322701 /DNA_START=126 /DNA_END=1393 /DNA_ORIENTATION=+
MGTAPLPPATKPSCSAVTNLKIQRHGRGSRQLDADELTQACSSSSPSSAPPAVSSNHNGGDELMPESKEESRRGQRENKDQRDDELVEEMKRCDQERSALPNSSMCEPDASHVDESAPQAMRAVEAGNHLRGAHDIQARHPVVRPVLLPKLHLSTVGRASASEPVFGSLSATGPQPHSRASVWRHASLDALSVSADAASASRSRSRSPLTSPRWTRDQLQQQQSTPVHEKSLTSPAIRSQSIHLLLSTSTTPSTNTLAASTTAPASSDSLSPSSPPKTRTDGLVRAVSQLTVSSSSPHHVNSSLSKSQENHVQPLSSTTTTATASARRESVLRRSVSAVLSLEAGGLDQWSSVLEQRATLSDSHPCVCVIHRCQVRLGEMRELRKRFDTSLIDDPEELLVELMGVFDEFFDQALTVCQLQSSS